EFEVTANILYGNIEILDGIPVGEMVVILSGDEEKLRQACQAITDSQVQLTLLKEGGKA
ncbi:methionine ABC transporter ATP-binding protein, partial [Streptococcus agalactiae]|nr:methionine ABC transporter ATP-binding protein [Streptococcus agalactiae]MCC9983446.1 methionine ABC transporter ATP-binding protein [Streptococcus agalactiae]